ncbi:hypothetical protein ABKN59_001717 [Abortiporus biennis]
MGQYWVVVNIDKRQILHEIGKLGVSLFNGTFDDIECHLQRFEASYRNPEVIVVAHWDKNETASEDKHVFQGERTKWEIKSISAPLSRSTLGVFRKVPNEIIYHILEQVIDIVDLIMFSLTNTNVYFPGYKVIQRRYIEAANWEGDRIICIGDNSDWMELPPNSFTKAELERIYTDYGLDFNLELESQDENEDIQDEYYALGVSRDPLARNLKTRWSTPYHYVLETFDQPRSNYDLRSSARQAVERRLERSGPIFRQNIFPLTTACFDSRAPQCPPDKPDLLLCNISKRVHLNEVLDTYGREERVEGPGPLLFVGSLTSSSNSIPGRR